MKGNESQMVKPTTASRAIDALIGDEEQKGKHKKENKTETWSRLSTQPPWSIFLNPTTLKDHMVFLF